MKTQQEIEREIRRLRQVVLNYDDENSLLITNEIKRLKDLIMPIWNERAKETQRKNMDKILNVYFL